MQTKKHTVYFLVIVLLAGFSIYWFHYEAQYSNTDISQAIKQTNQVIEQMQLKSKLVEPITSEKQIEIKNTVQPATDTPQVSTIKKQANQAINQANQVVEQMQLKSEPVEPVTSEKQIEMNKQLQQIKQRLADLK